MGAFEEPDEGEVGSRGDDPVGKDDRAWTGTGSDGALAGPAARGGARSHPGQTHRPGNLDDELDRHRMDAGSSLFGVRHAGRLRDAGSRLRKEKRNRERADGMYIRYLPLRYLIL